MDAFLGIVLFAMVLGFAWIIWKMFLWFIHVLFSPVGSATSQTTTSSSDAPDEIGGMNEGDLHSGPHGYSPNTAYPDTQYGSGFDEEEDWAQEH